MQFYAEIARRLTESKNIQDAFDTITEACMYSFNPEHSAIFTYDSAASVFIRKSLHSKTNAQGISTFPVYLKLSQLFEPYAQKKYLTNTLHPSPFFETDPFVQGSELIIPVRFEKVIVVLIICTTKERINLNRDQEIFCAFIENIFGVVLRNFTYENEIDNLRGEIQKRETINSNRLQLINERLRKSNQELKQFAYLASHDLQEPLRMITNYIDLYFRYYGNQLSEDGREYLSYAKDGASRMHLLVKDLLTYARLDYSEEPKKHFEGNKMLGEAMQNLQVAIEENDALIFYRDMPEIYGHETQMVSLFQNLIDNAIKYKGAEKPMVFIDANEAKDKLEFSIKDNGIGIEPQFHEKIFEFFSRLHAKDEYKGTGLGLSICKKIVDKHAGNIFVESTSGNGSDFKFSIAKQ